MSSITISSRIDDGRYTGTQQEALADLKTIQDNLGQKGFRSGHLHLVTGVGGTVQLQRKSWFQRWREGSAATKANDETTAAFVRCLMERAYGESSEDKLSESGGSTPRYSDTSSNVSSISSTSSTQQGSWRRGKISIAPSRSTTVMPQYRLASYLRRTRNRVGIQSLLNLLKHSEKDTDIQKIQCAGDEFTEDSLRAFFKSRGMLVSEPEKSDPGHLNRSVRWEIRFDKPQSNSYRTFTFATKRPSISAKEISAKEINQNELTVIKVEVKKDNSSVLYSVPRGKAQEFLDQHQEEKINLIGSLSRITLPEATSPRPSLFKSGSADTLSTASITDESSPRSSSPSLSSRPSTVRANTSHPSLLSRASSFLRRGSSPPSVLDEGAVNFKGNFVGNDVIFKKVADTTKLPDSGE